MVRAFLASLLIIAAAPAKAEYVDVQLALLVDVSRSMSPYELEIQRRGYAEALTSDEVLGVIEQSFTGKIAVTYIEWAGWGMQRTVVGWTTISNREDAERFASILLSDFPFPERRTSISGAIDAGIRAILSSKYTGLRKVIDVSGDGPNNQGPVVTLARDRAVGHGIVINGLPLMTRDGNTTTYDLVELDLYYRDCVIGGPGSFVIPVVSWDEFPQAVRRKLVLEIAGIAPEPVPDDTVVPVQGYERVYDCLIGEKIWQRNQMIFGP